MNQNQTNNNSKSWRTKNDEFRGYVKAKLEDLEKKIDGHCESAEERRKEIADDLTKIKEYVAGKRAISKFKNGIWGALGGSIFMATYFFLQWLISKFIGG